MKVNNLLVVQEMASPRRAAQRCEPTSTSSTSSTISRPFLNCHTDWSLAPERQLWLLRCVSQTMPRNSLSVFVTLLSGLCWQPPEGATRDREKQQRKTSFVTWGTIVVDGQSGKPESRLLSLQLTAELQFLAVLNRLPRGP